jgi:pimeloyl-ACP methyl ester carboxylesterase
MIAIQVSIDGGRAPLHGTLLMPDGSAQVPGAVIIAGSGPTDRDGNQPGLRNDSLKLLANGLAEVGIATLRADKRGIGESAGAAAAEQQLRLRTYVDDAVSWVGFLRTQPRVSRVFLLGHSEGALVATLAAQRTRIGGLVLIAGAGIPAGILLRRQLDMAELAPSVRQAAEAIVASLEQGRQVSEVPTDLSALFRPSVQPYLISWLCIDPVAELAKVNVPALVIQGTTDIQASVEDANRLRSSRSGVDIVILAGVNHVLKEMALDRAANIASYSDPARPLAGSVAPAIAAFIQGREV